MKTLRDIVRDQHTFDHVSKMTNYNLIDAISDALVEMQLTKTVTTSTAIQLDYRAENIRLHSVIAEMESVRPSIARGLNEMWETLGVDNQDDARAKLIKLLAIDKYGKAEPVSNTILNERINDWGNKQYVMFSKWREINNDDSGWGGWLGSAHNADIAIEKYERSHEKLTGDLMVLKAAFDLKCKEIDGKSFAFTVLENSYESVKDSYSKVMKSNLVFGDQVWTQANTIKDLQEQLSNAKVVSELLQVALDNTFTNAGTELDQNRNVIAEQAGTIDDLQEQIRKIKEIV